MAVFILEEPVEASECPTTINDCHFVCEADKVGRVQTGDTNLDESELEFIFGRDKIH